MTDRQLLLSLAASLTIHLALVPVASLFFNRKESITLPLPIQLIEVPHVKQVEDSEPTSSETVPKPKPQTITAPRLLSKPQISASRWRNSAKNVKEPTHKLESLEPHEQSGSDDLPETPPEAGWDIVASNPRKDDTAAAGGIVIPGGGDTTADLDRGPKEVGRAGGIGPSKVASIDARPVEGHQSKPQYPESARRARAQGTAFLKFRVLATGKVGEVFVEKSAGRRDLDEAAADAVKKWLFEPARVGTEPVSVWVILPVEFKLN